MDSMSNKKSAALLKSYWEKLEEFRLTLVPPVIKGTGEIKRLRSEIGDLYTSVVGQEAAPGNLQLQRVGFLKDELSKAEQKFALLRQQFEKKVMEALQKEKGSTIKKSSVKN